MKELFKRLAILGSGAALLAGSAFANIGNSGTGENSLNKVDVDGHNRTSITTDNDADVNNDLDVDANTGFNAILGSNMNHDNHDKHCEDDECGGNTAAGDKTVNTGNASASAEVTNRVNRTTVNASMPGMDVGDVGNMDTGKNSENCVEVDMDNNLDIRTDNDADVHNDVDVNANTGFNLINSSGRGDSTITTGNATASATVTNEVNTTSVTVQ